MIFDFLDDNGNVLTTQSIQAEDYAQTFVGTDWNGATVTSVIRSVADARRAERELKFSKTIDRVNYLWYDSLTDEEKTELSAWRTAWLDYPTLGVKPDDLNMFI